MAESPNSIENLLCIMSRLRDPLSGCPWDLQQTFRTLAPYILEEAYETVDAIESDNFADLCDELGDLLLQVVFCSRLGEEQGLFTFSDVVRSISEKMVRRHPHVFGDATATDPEAVKAEWERIKSEERRAKNESPESLLDTIPLSLESLTLSLKLQKQAAKVGFDWQELRPVISKIREELDELESAIDIDSPSSDISGEIGDILFSVVNLARHLRIDPEQSLRRTNRKFRARFSYIERSLSASGKSMEEVDLPTLESLWQESKSVLN